MKRYIKYFAVSTIGILSIAACKKSFIEVNPKGTSLESSYYKNRDEAFNGLVAVYDVVGWQGNGYVTKENTMDAGSDDHFAGGGSATDINDLQVFSNYTLTPATGPQGELWKAGFSGIFRANTLLEKLPDVPMDENEKARFTAEAKFLRAYFYFDLVRLFKNVPLFTAPVSTTEMYNVVQASPEDVYKQIEQDLKDAIAEPNLPNIVPVSTDGGRVTKGAAHALLGKVYLYEKNWSDAATELKEVNGTPGQLNSTYGYQLLSDFADLWKTSNKFNSESIFEVAHSSKSSGDWGCISCSEGNILDILVGPRGYTPIKPDAPDYVSGWSFLIITPDLFNAMHTDPRFQATILDMDSLQANGIASYTPGYSPVEGAAGHFLNKFAGRLSDKTTGAGAAELNYPQNLYEIRLADTYLMEAEALIQGGGDLTRAAALINAVRNRAYNDGQEHNVAATMDNLKRERRFELVGEGHRWFDLVRWGDAATVLASRGFVAGKNEVLPIPLNEMDNTKIEQNKEWGGTK